MKKKNKNKQTLQIIIDAFESLANTFEKHASEKELFQTLTYKSAATIIRQAIKEQKNELMKNE
jgi:dihydroneopterin aldolase